MEDADISTLLSILSSKTVIKEDKVESYKKITLQFKNDDPDVVCLHTSSKSKKLLSVLQKDIVGDDVEVCQTALQVFGYYLHDTECIRHLSVSDSKSVFGTLCTCIQKTEDKIACTRALWCLYHQSLPVEILRTEVAAILDALEEAFSKWSSQSTTVEFESCHVINCLLKQCRKEMNSYMYRWIKLMLPLIVHGAVKVRETAFDVISKELSTPVSLKKEASSLLMEECKTKICPEMKKLFSVNHHEIYVLKCWEILIQLIGEALHHGGFINHMLPIVELGLKSPSVETKIAAFYAWQHLIDNFALNPDILTDPRRVKLIMQVFKCSNTNIESGAMTKLRVWWHFIWLLGAKASAYFEQVCLPLIRYCVAGSQSSTGASVGTPRMLKNGTSPITPRLNLTSSSPQTAKFPAIQLKGCEVLAHFLGSIPKDLDVPHYSSSLDTLNHDIISGPAFFVKHACFFITSVTELFCSIGKDIPEGLLYRIWYSLVAHLKNGLDMGVKSELRDVFTTFLTQFQILVLSQSLPHKTILKMFHAVCCLPRKALSSTACNVSSGEKMHGTPALFLTELLLTPTLLKSCCTMESYISLYSNLVNSGLGHSGTLEYCQSLIDLLDRNVEFVDNAEIVWRLWSSVATPLYEYVNKSGEVNQGDALEHNFGCLYAVLQFPILNRLAAKMPQMTVKSLLKSWTDMYRMFARLAALVTNAEANICCEHLCHNVIKSVPAENFQNELFLDSLIQSCLVMVNAVDFSSLGSGGSFNINGLSPAKWVKKKQKPMENIHSLTVLVGHLLTALTHQIGNSNKAMKSDGSLHGPANNIVEILTMLFTHISASGVLAAVIGQLSQPISVLYHDAANKTSAKIYNNLFMQKLEKLWLDISTSVQSRYTGLYETEFLENISPLLESTFLHPRRAIKNQTIILWNATFSKSSSLKYPEKIKPILTKVKEKTQIHLPGWIASNVQVIEETPVSQMSQAESQAPEPHIPGMPSPRKVHGSFMNKVSPKAFRSPVRTVTNEAKSPNPAKKQILPVNGMKNDDFVVIKSPPKKKRVLTEHQKEVFKEKRVFPAMYNSLDLSQDISLMNHFSSDTQSETPTPTSDSVIILDASQTQKSPGSNGVLPEASNKFEVKEKVVEKMTEKSSETKTVARRRSVRFKETEDDTLKDGKVKLDKKKTDSLEEFNETWDKALSTAVTDGEVIQRSDEEKSGIEHFKVIKECISDSKETTISSGKSLSNSSSWEEYPNPQNVMEVVNLESLSVKTSSGSDSSSKETRPSQESTTQDSEESLQKSQPLLSWSNHLKELSQSSPKTAKISKLFTSPSKSVKLRQSPGKAKSKVGTEKPIGNLDKWLVKSQSKTSVQENSEVNKTSLPTTTKVNNVMIVEETLSPSKFSKESSTVKRADVIPPIMETPPRPYSDDSENSNSNKGSIRKLFMSNDETLALEVVEDSNIIPASPESRNSVYPVKVATPIIKLKKLTDDEIKQYSPSQKEPGTPQGQRETKICSADRNIIKELSHEHDDFSEIKPIDDTGALSSQGFELNETIEPELEKKLQMEEKDTSKREREDNSSQNLEPSALSTKDEVMDSEPYDPAITSTFASNSRVQKLFGTENLKSSPSAVSASESSQSQETSVQSGMETYDPKKESTIVAEIGTPGRGRKRKQEVPKKLSPESIRPKRRRKSKYSRDNSSQEEDEQDAATPIKVKGKQENVTTICNSQGPGSKEGTLNDALSENNPSIKSDEINSALMENKDSQVNCTDVNDKETNDKEKKNSDIVVVRGEKTPESRTTNSTPQRKSTTKKKKEVAQRRLHAADTDSQDSEFGDSTEDAPLIQAVQNLEEKIIKNIEKEGKELNLKADISSDSDNEIDIPLSKLSKEKNESNVSDASTDDNLPLLALCKERKQNSNSNDNKLQKKDDNTSHMDSDEEENNKNLQNSPSKKDKKDQDKLSQKIKPVSAKTSPLSTRLRSSGRVLRTRGKPLRRSTSPVKGTPKSLTLKKLRRKTIDSVGQNDEIDGSVLVEKTTHKVVDEQLKETESGSKNSVNTEEAEGANLHSKNIQSAATERNISFVDQGEIQNESEKTCSEKTAESRNDSETKSKSAISKVTEISDKQSEDDCFSETPRKTPNMKTARVGFALFDRHSDSKLVTVSRKFEKRLVARRSILKPGVPSANYENLSPIKKHGSRFHPIRPGHIFAPAASPSASILKRRRLSGDVATNSPSPPSKQRRVSFAEPLTMEQVQSDMAKSDVSSTKPEAPAPSSPVCTAVTMHMSSEKVSNSPGSSFTSSSITQSSQKKELSQSLGSYKSTQESELSTTDPVYPQLVKCSESVEKVLPQLTSSMWARGLGQLVRARNIHTIGDLSALTEREIHNLPIRSPKVSNVRRVLKCYEGQQEGKKVKQNKADQPLGDEKEDVTQVAELVAAENLNDKKEQLVSENEDLLLSAVKSAESEALTTSVGDFLNNSADLLVEVNKFTNDVAESISQTNSSLIGSENLFRRQLNDEESQQTYGSVCTPKICESQSGSKASLPMALADIVNRCSAENLQQLKTQELFDIHHNLVTLTNAVVNAMKMRCSSHDNSQS